MKFLFCFFILFLSDVVYAKKKAFDDYKTKVEVPEPLYIDLVRSLTSEVGEWEINSLFHHTQGDYGQLKWAPEVEFVLFDGTAIEFELPMRGPSLKTYKFAFQQRIYQSKKLNQVHGLQLIYESNKKFNASQLTAYYIMAHRFSHHWSLIGLYGLKTLIQNYEGLEYQINQSVFYNYSREIDLGFEVNFASNGLGEGYVQIVPQLHLAFDHGYKIQFGFGALNDGQLTSPTGTFRIIKEFN